jgi:hypothetical protein
VRQGKKGDRKKGGDEEEEDGDGGDGAGGDEEVNLADLLGFAAGSMFAGGDGY